MPSEFNLSPIYRHRLDEKGDVLEMDVLWPIVHYEQTQAGGADFRIRPFYRVVTKPDTDGFGPKPNAEKTARTAADHQFLWPLGRVRTNSDELHARVFPIWSYDHRKFNDGRSESDWYFLFPFLWGGSDRATPESDAEHYFGVFPLYLDAPREFLTYDRLTMVLWPLYTRTEKDGKVGNIFLWPLLGFGSGEKEPDTRWHRVLPLYTFIEQAGRFFRYSVLWPIFSWGQENLDTDDPLTSYGAWPLFTRQASKKRSSWSFLWPFFRREYIEGRYDKLNLLWPFFQSLYDNREGQEVHSWWLWPFFGRTKALHQDSWTALWPLIWWRKYDDPDGVQTQRWVVPFYKAVHRDWKDGGEDDYLQVWPLFHTESKRNGTGEWSFPSLWFWRDGNEEGVGAAYDWFYTLVRSRSRAADDHAIETMANVYTSRTRGEQTWRSVPFLFSYAGSPKGKTLYLFNCIPISWGGDDR